MIFYTMPSLVSLSLDKVLAAGCPPAPEVLPLPRHLKDGLRRVLLKRGAVTGPELGCLLHPGVSELDLSDCLISHQHLAVISTCSAIRKLCLNQCYQDQQTSHEDLSRCSRMLRALLVRNSRLSVLNMRKVPFVKDVSLSFLPASLTHLDLAGCSALSDGAVRRLTGSCPRLVSLSLSDTPVTDRSLVRLSVSRCRASLRELRISDCLNITDAGIEALLAGSTALQVFIFHGCPRVTEKSRLSLQTFLDSVGRHVRQVTWTVY